MSTEPKRYQPKQVIEWTIHVQCYNGCTCGYPTDHIADNIVHELGEQRQTLLRTRNRVRKSARVQSLSFFFSFIF